MNRHTDPLEIIVQDRQFCKKHPDLLTDYCQARGAKGIANTGGMIASLSFFAAGADYLNDRCLNHPFLFLIPAAAGLAMYLAGRLLERRFRKISEEKITYYKKK